MSIAIPDVVLRATLLSTLRNLKKLPADIVEFDRMREYDDRRTLKWLTESIGRPLAMDRAEWARQLQRKSLTSGAIDVDLVLGAPSKGKGGKGRGKNKGKGTGKGKRDSSRDSSNSPKADGICHMYVIN